MNRGDDIDFIFRIESGTPLKPVKCLLEEGEALYFGVMQPNQQWENAILRKKLTNEDMDEDGNIKLHLFSKDTENIIPGTYYYMVKIYIYDDILQDYVVNTIVDKTKFIIW